jgi:hypothetical protein
MELRICAVIGRFVSQKMNADKNSLAGSDVNNSYNVSSRSKKVELGQNSLK